MKSGKKKPFLSLRECNTKFSGLGKNQWDFAGTLRFQIAAVSWRFRIAAIAILRFAHLRFAVSPYFGEIIHGDHPGRLCEKTSPSPRLQPIKVQGLLDSGGSNGGGSLDLDSSVPIGPFWPFPILGDFLDFVSDFPDLSFSSFSAQESTYKEHCRKGPRHNQDISRKKVGKPPWGLETPWFSFFQVHPQLRLMTFESSHPAAKGVRQEEFGKKNLTK